MIAPANLTWWYAVILWGLVLGGVIREIQRLCGDRGPCWLPLAASWITLLHWEGLPAGRWMHGFTSNLSIPLAAILLHSVISPVLRSPLLDARAERQTWTLGFVLGMVLYPAALGLGPFDSYLLGWRNWGVAMWMALPTALLLWQRDRLGYILLAAAIAWQLGILESNNAWDYVVDPIFFLISCTMLLGHACRQMARWSAPSAVPTRLCSDES
jgi:hypothetical protein